MFDGDEVIELDGSEVLKIRESEKNTALILLKDVPFLVNIREKLARV